MNMRISSILLSALMGVVLMFGAAGAWAAGSQYPAEKHLGSSLFGPDPGREVSVGGYGGTMGTGVRLEFDLSGSLAPFSATYAKRDVTLQATTGENLDTSREVWALAYEPRLLATPKALGHGVQLLARVAFPIGLTVGENKNASEQITEWVPSSTGRGGDYVTRDLAMRSEDKGAQVGAFVGLQPAVEFGFGNKYSLTVGADIAVGAPFSGGSQAWKDVDRLGGFVNLGVRF